MKSCFRIFTVTVIAAAMAGCGGDDTEPEPDIAGAVPYRVLAIGNSFSQDAMRYIRDILIKNGAAAEDIDIVNAYIGGQNLAGHAICAKTDLPSYTRESFGIKGAITKNENVTLKDIITSNNWDYITLQQASADSGRPNTYTENGNLSYLIDYIKANATNPNVKIGWHMTWAYANSYPDQAFNNYGNNQGTMYNAIVKTVQDEIRDSTGFTFDFIIPTGTAIQNARKVYGDNLNSDGTHLNDLGRFIAGAMWVRQIYGRSVDVFDSDYEALNGYTLTVDDMAKIDKCVQNAFDDPFDVTE
jgi:hypothetical protein